MKSISTIRNGLSRLWWIPLITGILCIGIGVWLFCSPETSLAALAYTFAGCMIAAGVLNCIYALTARGIGGNWGWALALGLLELVAGAWLFTLPAMLLTEAFIIVVGIWILVAAINSICETAMLSAYSPAWIGWMICLLCATVFLSIIFLSSPITGGIAVWLYLGISFLCFGVFRIALAFKIRKINSLL